MGMLCVAQAQMWRILLPPPASGLPPKPPSPGFLTLFKITPRSWNCGDCVSVTDSKLHLYDTLAWQINHPFSQLAWCVVNCALKDKYDKALFAEAFLGNVNRWLQQEVANNYMPHTVLCEAWNIQAQLLAVPEVLLPCDLRCNGEFHILTTVTMQHKLCMLPAGHISITLVQRSEFQYQQTFRSIHEKLLQSATQTSTLFYRAHWLAADNAAGSCAACTDGACLYLHTQHMTGTGSLFTIANLPS